MIKFYPLTMNGKIKARSVKPNEHFRYGGWIYLHYELDAKNHYDLTAFDDTEIPTTDGIYDCVVVFSKKEQIEAKLYLWFTSIEGSDQMQRHGLIVANTDTKGQDDANKKYIGRYVII